MKRSGALLGLSLLASAAGIAGCGNEPQRLTPQPPTIDSRFVNKSYEGLVNCRVISEIFSMTVYSDVHSASVYFPEANETYSKIVNLKFDNEGCLTVSEDDYSPYCVGEEGRKVNISLDREGDSILESVVASVKNEEDYFLIDFYNNTENPYGEGSIFEYSNGQAFLDLREGALYEEYFDFKKSWDNGQGTHGVNNLSRHCAGVLFLNN